MSIKYILAFIFIFLSSSLQAATQPKFTIIPTGSTSFDIVREEVIEVQYRVTNQTAITRQLIMTPIPGFTQVTEEINHCSNIFTLAHGQSCLLTLRASGSQFNLGTTERTVKVCKLNPLNNSSDPFLCSQTEANNTIKITIHPSVALIAVSPKILELNTGGTAEQLSITNLSSKVTATNIRANLTGTSLSGNVEQNANDCNSLLPGQTCALIFTPGNTAVNLTKFPIQGDNTNTLTAAIKITSTNASLLVTGSPLTLTPNGSSGVLTVYNVSPSITATNITSNFEGTALDGNVTETGNTCASVAPLSHCTLTYTPGSTAVPLTDFTIQGDNTDTVTAAIAIVETSADLSVSGSPLTLTTNGPTGTLTINNLSSSITATNITSNFAGTALEGNVSETGNTCASVAPLSSCTLTYTPGSTAVAQTNFTIQGTNTSTLTAAISIVTTDAAITVTGSPLTLSTNGSSGTLTINNTSSSVTATNITSDFTGTALEGNVSQTGSTCTSVAPLSSCTLTYTPGNTVVAQTNFTIQGTNTNTLTAAIGIVASDAAITVTGSPLTLLTNGSAGTLTVNNTSNSVTATNITADFTGTALEGNVSETGNTCLSVAPLSSCTLTFTPGSTAVAQTNFPIQGSNTNTITAAIQIDESLVINTVSPASGPASGGSGITVSGTGFTGATSLTFGGVAATYLNVVNSTTVTAVTPAHATGAVDVVITTPSGSATKTNGFTYLTTAIGQPAYGGKIACLNGSLNNLIAATVDNSEFIFWGATSNTGAQSTTDGAANTNTIVAQQGTGGSTYAALLCYNYEIDSLGHSPCQSGNACYSDWFLPAGDNITTSGQLNCLYVNRSAIGSFYNTNYWSSTEYGAGGFAWGQDFSSGANNTYPKYDSLAVRCVRAFTP